jgi:hypothetical protein
MPPLRRCVALAARRHSVHPSPFSPRLGPRQCATSTHRTARGRCTAARCPVEQLRSGCARSPIAQTRRGATCLGDPGEVNSICNFVPHAAAASVGCVLRCTRRRSSMHDPPTVHGSLDLSLSHNPPIPPPAPLANSPEEAHSFNSLDELVHMCLSLVETHTAGAAAAVRSRGAGARCQGTAGDHLLPACQVGASGPLRSAPAASKPQHPLLLPDPPDVVVSLVHACWGVHPCSPAHPLSPKSPSQTSVRCLPCDRLHVAFAISYGGHRRLLQCCVSPIAIRET